MKCKCTDCNPPTSAKEREAQKWREDPAYMGLMKALRNLSNTLDKSNKVLNKINKK